MTGWKRFQEPSIASLLPRQLFAHLGFEQAEHLFVASKIVLPALDHAFPLFGIPLDPLLDTPNGLLALGQEPRGLPPVFVGDVAGHVLKTKETSFELATGQVGIPLRCFPTFASLFFFARGLFLANWLYSPYLNISFSI